MRAYKFRLYPNHDQEILINKTFGSTRYIYNYFLDQKTKLYKEHSINKTAYECCADIKLLSKEYEWLKEVDSCALRCAIFDLDDAFSRFFKKLGSYPNFKSKFKKNSYRTNNMTGSYKGKEYNSVKLDLVKNIVTLPKLKEVKIRGYRNLSKINGRIINATISKENNRYYVSVVTSASFECPKTNASGIIGIDVGVKNLVTTSDNETFDNKKVINKYAKSLRHLQRLLAKKIPKSKNYYKCLAKINSIYRKIKNTRKYYLHQISKKLTDTYKIIVTESLSIKRLLETSSSKLSKAIQDASIYELFRQMEYKSRNKGNLLYQIDQYYPSSQKCARCGNIEKNMKEIDKRMYECTSCGNQLDRDYNASLNIMDEGLNMYMKQGLKVI